MLGPLIPGFAGGSRANQQFMSEIYPGERFKVEMTALKALAVVGQLPGAEKNGPHFGWAVIRDIIAAEILATLQHMLWAEI